MTALDHTPTQPAPIVQTITIEALTDPVIDQFGHHVSSLYCETFHLPVIGPTALWLLRLAARHTTDGPWAVEASDLGKALGLGGSFHKNSPLHRTFDRLKSFRCADGGWNTTWRLATHLPPLTRRQLDRLPATLQAEHNRWIGGAS